MQQYEDGAASRCFGKLRRPRFSPHLMPRASRSIDEGAAQAGFGSSSASTTDRLPSQSSLIEAPSLAVSFGMSAALSWPSQPLAHGSALCLFRVLPPPQNCLPYVPNLPCSGALLSDLVERAWVRIDPPFDTLCYSGLAGPSALSSARTEHVSKCGF